MTFAKLYRVSRRICRLFECLLRSSNRSIFLVFKIFDGRDFNLKVEIELAQICQVVADLWSKKVKIIGCLKAR